MTDSKQRQLKQNCFLETAELLSLSERGRAFLYNLTMISEDFLFLLSLPFIFIFCLFVFEKIPLHELLVFSFFEGGGEGELKRG